MTSPATTCTFCGRTFPYGEARNNHVAAQHGPFVIGTMTVTAVSEPRSENHTSYAADYRTFQVLPGVYDIVFDGVGYGPYSVKVTADIAVLKEVCFSGFGGVNFARHEAGPSQTTKTFGWYGYQAAGAYAHGRWGVTAETVTWLSPGWKAAVAYTNLHRRAYFQPGPGEMYVSVGHRFVPVS